MNIPHKLFIIASLAFFSIMTGCTKKIYAPNPIVINFLDVQSLPKYTHVRNGEEVVMIIKNVNQNIFKVESTVTQTDQNIDLPAVFSGIKLPGSLNLSLPSASPAAGALALSPEKKKDIEKNINEKLAIINGTSSKIMATVELNNKILNIINSCGKSYSVIKRDLIDLVNNYLHKQTPATDQVKEINVYIERTIKQATDAKIELDKLIPEYLSNLPDTPRKDVIKELYDKATASVAEIEKIKDDNKIQALIDNYNLINEANFNFTSEKIKVNADEVNFNIKITSEKPLPCNIPAKTIITETYRTKGGLKIDFSSGAFFNFGNPDFLGRDIQYKPANDTVVTIQAKDGGSRLLLSIGAFMHIYKRSGNKVNFALSPGISTTTGFDALNFHLGASVLFGNENRFVITVGTTLRESKILDKNYEFDKQYKKSLLPEAPPTIAVFPKWGGFISFTYNFSKFKKQG